MSKFFDQLRVFNSLENAAKAQEDAKGKVAQNAQTGSVSDERIAARRALQVLAGELDQAMRRSIEAGWRIEDTP